MTDLNLTRLRQIAQDVPMQGDWEDSGKRVTTQAEDGWGVAITPILSRKTIAAHIAAFDPPTVLALIDRIEQAGHRVKRYKALAETRLETIQRVRDLHAREVIAVHESGPEVWCSPCQQHYPCPTIQALEGDPA